MTSPGVPTLVAPRSELSPAALCGLASHLRLASLRIARRGRIETPPALAPHQFSLLCRLEEEPRTASQLARMEKVSAPSITRTLAGLTRRGLVMRTVDPTDRRRVVLTLTDVATRLLGDIRREQNAWLVVRLERLPSFEQALVGQAAAILTRIANE